MLSILVVIYHNVLEDDDFDSSSMDFDEPSMTNPASVLYGQHQYDYINPNTSTSNASSSSSGFDGVFSGSSNNKSQTDVMRFGSSRGVRSGSQDDDDLLMGPGSSALPHRGLKPGAPDERVIDKDFFNSR